MRPENFLGRIACGRLARPEIDMVPTRLIERRVSRKRLVHAVTKAISLIETAYTHAPRRNQPIGRKPEMISSARCSQ